jgi:hypothetical protein
MTTTFLLTPFGNGFPDTYELSFHPVDKIAADFGYDNASDDRAVAGI